MSCLLGRKLPVVGVLAVFLVWDDRSMGDWEGGDKLGDSFSDYRFVS